jgi:hypothetical protein
LSISQLTIPNIILIGGFTAKAATELCTSEILAVACSHTTNTVILAQMEMVKTNLASMSVDALLKLRGDIEKNT